MGLFSKGVLKPDYIIFDDPLMKHTPNDIRALFNVPPLSKDHEDQLDALCYAFHAQLLGGIDVKNVRAIKVNDIPDKGVVEFKDGTKLIRLGADFYNRELNPVGSLGNTNSEAIWKGNRALKVYTVHKDVSLNEAFIPFMSHLIIQVYEPKKMTISQIEKELGYPVEIVKEVTE